MLLHQPAQRQPFGGREVMEVEAESVAFMVTAAHGLDASQYTFNYVAGWAQQATTPDGPSVEEIIKATGQRVIGAADRILQATQPAPTIVDEALADLTVQLNPAPRVDAAPLIAATHVDAAGGVRVEAVRTPPAAAAGAEPASLVAVGSAPVWERVAPVRLDGAAHDRLALPAPPVAARGIGR